MDWQLDPAHTSVEAQAKHMMFTRIRVRFPGATGEISFDPRSPESARVSLDIPVATVQSGEERRDAHLRSADFFDAERYPVIAFRSAEVRKVGSDRFAVAGDLSIRGTTRRVTVEVELQGPLADPMAEGRSRAFIEAKARIDRRDWGLTWNMPVPQGVLVSNEIVVEVAGQLTAAEPASQAA